MNMNAYRFILPVLLLAPGDLLRADETPSITKIAFGSCCKQDRPVPIFDTVVRYKPDLWIWMGDNIYADTRDMGRMAGKYAELLSNKKYDVLRKSCRVIGTWDDHDYGENDAGGEYPEKVASQQHLLDFLEVPEDSDRRKRKGVYASHTFGSPGQQVKVLLLDTRYHRDAPGPKGDILGEVQWKWLERELRESIAQVHLIVSSIQLLPTGHRYEKWANFPTARARFLKLLSDKEIPPVTILSGDRHLAEISVSGAEMPYPLHEITSSSLNRPFGGASDELNGRRIGKNYAGVNFGTVTIDWSRSPPALAFAVRNQNGIRMLALKLQQEK